MEETGEDSGRKYDWPHLHYLLFRLLLNQIGGRRKWMISPIRMIGFQRTPRGGSSMFTVKIIKFRGGIRKTDSVCPFQ